MKTYNHAFTIAFAVRGSTCPTGEGVTALQLREALAERMNSLPPDELLEAVGLPFDTYEEVAYENQNQ